MAEYDLLAEYGIAIPNGSTPFESRLRSDACRVVHTIIRPPAPSSKSSAQVLKLAARPPPVPVVQHIEPKKTRWKKSVLPLHIQKAKSMIMKSLLQPDLVTSPTAAKKASSLLKRQPEPMTLHRNDPSRETLHHVRSCSGGISSNQTVAEMAERLVTLDPNVTLKARQSLLPPWNPQYLREYLTSGEQPMTKPLHGYSGCVKSRPTECPEPIKVVSNPTTFVPMHHKRHFPPSSLQPKESEPVLSKRHYPVHSTAQIGADTHCQSTTRLLLSPKRHFAHVSTNPLMLPKDQEDQEPTPERLYVTTSMAEKSPPQQDQNQTTKEQKQEPEERVHRPASLVTAKARLATLARRKAGELNVTQMNELLMLRKRVERDEKHVAEQQRWSQHLRQLQAQDAALEVEEQKLRKIRHEQSRRDQAALEKTKKNKQAPKVEPNVDFQQWKERLARRRVSTLEQKWDRQLAKVNQERESWEDKIQQDQQEYQQALRHRMLLKQQQRRATRPF